MRTAELRTRATATSFSCNVDRRENRPEGVSGSVARDPLVNGGERAIDSAAGVQRDAIHLSSLKTISVEDYD